MITIKRSTKYLTLLSTVLILTSAGVDTAKADLTASTSLTVVHVTDFVQSKDITHWAGAWPQPPVAPKTANDITMPSGQEVYLNNAYFTTHSMSWAVYPKPMPYPQFPNTISAMVAAVWSSDGGKTFKLQSWDYLTPSRTNKGTEHGMPDCWMGTMVHSICDRKGGECNGRNRSNLYFTEYPANAAGCWGSAVSK